MTTPVPVPPLIQAAPWPALGSPNYNDEAYAAGSTQPAAFARQAEIAQSGYDNAQISHDNSLTALQAKDLAVAAAEVATAVANFLGIWGDLTGPAPRGSSVKHNNRFWIAVDDIADVTASEPGVSSDWTSVGGGVVVQRVSTDTVMTPGVLYVVEVPAVTLTAPVLLLPGDVLQMSNATSANVFVDFNGHTVKGQVPDSPMAIPRWRGFSLTYSGDTLA